MAKKTKDNPIPVEQEYTELNEVCEKIKSPELIITADDLPVGANWIRRSMMASEGLYQRFDDFAASHPQYSKKAIFEKLLTESLEHYGY